MKNEPQNEPYYGDLIRLGYLPLSYSEKHYIFRKNERVLKIARQEYNDAQNDGSFAIEKAAHDILIKGAFPVAKIYRIYALNELVVNYSVLEEEYIEGDIFYQKDCAKELLIEVCRFAESVTNIKSNTYGLLNLNGTAEYSSWKSFIEQVIAVAHTDKEILTEGLSHIPKTCESCMVLTDLNIANFVFKAGKLKCAIDIERPLFGDKLFLYGVMKVRNPNMFDLIESKFGSEQKRLIDYYSLIYKHLFDML